MQVQKKMKKGDSITKIADDLVEDEIVILPIYKMVKGISRRYREGYLSEIKLRVKRIYNNM